MKRIKLYKTWEKAKQVFVKPSLRVYFGRRKNDPFARGMRNFCIWNFDVGWKPKFDQIRYEFPPQFSITAFGLSLTFTLHCPVKTEFSSDDGYWEAILNYIDTKSMEKTVDLGGIWTPYKNGEKKTPYFAVRPEYLKKEYLEEYQQVVQKLEQDYPEIVL